MTGTNCDLFTHKSSRSYLNHLVHHNKLVKLQFIVTSSNALTINVKTLTGDPEDKVSQGRGTNGWG